MSIEEQDIVRMTREAGGFDATPAFLKKFAELVAAHEREECAKVCETHLVYGELVHNNAVLGCVAEIRARSKA